jgi:hypothetical protein
MSQDKGAMASGTVPNFSHLEGAGCLGLVTSVT